jgi:hypothetical protein
MLKRGLYRLFPANSLFPVCLLVLGLLLAACQSSPSAVSLPATAVPFPTMTPGRVVSGVLLTLEPQETTVGLANPATAVALANLPTQTPDYSACPPEGNASLPARPASGADIPAELIQYLSSGGSVAALENGLRNDWKVMDDRSLLRADIDFTGSGKGGLLLTYSAPDVGGVLLILGCAAGRYYSFYQSPAGRETPQIVDVADLNLDGRPDVLYTMPECTPPKSKTCIYQSQLITWRPDSGRFVNLLRGSIASSAPPTLRDVDNDRISELVVRLTDAGSQETGPLRTGVNIYDWNGSAYVLSIIQLDPPRFQIQVIQEADRAFARQDTKAAAPLYQLALANKELKSWLPDEGPILTSYVLYRLLLLYAYTEDKQLLPTYQAIVTAYPDVNVAPIYATLSTTFWNSLQVTNNLHTACTEVQSIISTRPEALDLINRYGSRSPTLSAGDLCPF